MINTLTRTSEKSKADLDNLISNIYLLPQWEKIKEFSLHRQCFFFSKSYRVDLFRKFSSKNMLEKYSLRLSNDNVVGFMDLKVYKDSVYIISLDTDFNGSTEEIITKLVQVAVEKSLYNTTDKEVKINLSCSLIKQNRIKKVLLSLGFIQEEEQSKFEKDLFGEVFSLKAQESVFWQKQIKQMPILINK